MSERLERAIADTLAVVRELGVVPADHSPLTEYLEVVEGGARVAVEDGTAGSAIRFLQGVRRRCRQEFSHRANGGEEWIPKSGERKG